MSTPKQIVRGIRYNIPPGYLVGRTGSTAGPPQLLNARELIKQHLMSSAAAIVPVGANPTATAGPTAINGSALTFMRSDGAPAIQKASASQFGIVEVDNVTITATAGVIAAVQASGANPTATAGPTAINGSSTHFMRADGAPAIQLGSSSQFGIVEVDNTTITASAGVITAVTATGSVKGILRPDGTSISITSGVISTVNNGTVTSITAGTGLSGGTITTSGTIALASIADGDLLANISGGSAAPIANTLSAIIDHVFSSTQGAILYRGSSLWTALAPGAANQVLASGGASANPSWANVSSLATGVGPFHPGFVSGRYYTMPGVSFAPGGIAMAANIIYAVPFYVPVATTFTKISVNVTSTASGKHIEMGVYNNNSGVPGSLFQDCGEVTLTASTGSYEITGLSLVFSPGWYWLVCASDGTPTVQGVGAGVGMMQWLAGMTTQSDDTSKLTTSWVFSTGNLPNPFGTVSYATASTTPTTFLRL